MKKDTFFNILTKGNETQNQPSKSKRKILKAFGFGSLAVMMAVAGTFAFAPLGAGAQGGALASASEKLDQINTKADGKNIKYAPSPLGLDPENDPVIYTTESGLEIKFGGESVSDQLASGKPLSGYPYFTMGTYSGYAVNWVIIGRNTNDTVFTSAISAHLYSTWKTNNSASSATFENKGYYFFNNTYETTTPAGSAINGVVPSKSYVADVTKATKTVVGNDEVPQGCVLAISECSMGTSAFDDTNPANYEGSPLQTATLALYDSGLGLSTAQKNMIIAQNLTNCYNTSTNGATSTPTYNSTSNNQKIFPLATYGGYSSTAISNQNFFLDTYLTQSLRICHVIGTTTKTRYWSRSNNTFAGDAMAVLLDGSSYWADTTIVNSSPTSTGGTNFDLNCYHALGVRPAGVFKLG